jgi:hypothetical protein
MKTWSCPICRNYHTSGLDIAVDEGIAKHKATCWYLGGKMETNKEKSLEERLLSEYGELVRKLFLLQGNFLYVSTADVMAEGGSMAILKGLKTYVAKLVAKLESEKAEKAERERLKGIVREVLAERRDGTFDPTGTIDGSTQNPLTTDKA